MKHHQKMNTDQKARKAENQRRYYEKKKNDTSFKEKEKKRQKMKREANAVSMTKKEKKKKKKLRQQEKDRGNVELLKRIKVFLIYLELLLPLSPKLHHIENHKLLARL